MKAQKISKNTYRAKKTYKKKEYYAYFDHKPTQKEMVLAFADLFNEAPSNVAMNVRQAIDSYIQANEHVLALSTVRGYRVMQRNLPDGLASSQLVDLDGPQLQQYASDIMAEHTVKYCKNMMGLVLSVLKLYRPNFSYKVKYPKVSESDQEESYIPTHEEVAAINKEAEGTKYEIALLLASSCGLRRGEICALDIKDLSDDNMLSINKDMVQDDSNKWHIKPPKTKGSIRTIHINDYIADKIRAQGYIFDGNPFQIYDWLRYTQDKLGMRKFTLHSLRHYVCSVLADNNVPEATIMYVMGWSDPSVMKKVYRHPNISEQRLREVADIGFSWNDLEKNEISKNDLIEILKNMPDDTTFKVDSGTVLINI